MDNPSIRIYVNKIKNRVFENKIIKVKIVKTYHILKLQK